MIKHIVAWNYKEGFTDTENESNAEQVKCSLKALKDLIPEIISIKVVTDPASTSNRKVILTSTFADEAALAAYQIHPEHKRVSQFVGTVFTDRVCLDFYE